ncbi:hypothetical protein [Lentzea albidocapillata]|uniref:hypothetical protein n=1 Tax=Lentzea albidocapillata TaxID=40571 RepID=UPI00115FD73D|nr:hypothetical protein [Lentzea albidocapillata]
MTTVELGIDIGSVRTKVACRDQVWHGPSSADAAGVLPEVARREFGTEPGAAAVVVAVPDRWTTAGVDGMWTGAVERTAEGAELARVLTERAGFASVRLVPASQCVVAAHGGTSGCVLVCDVGGSSVTAAVYSCDATTSRLLDSESAETAVRESLRRAARVDPAEAAAFEDHRCHAAGRAAVVLERARTHERYLGTPVYLYGRDHVTAEAALSVLRPLATLAAEVVGTVLARVGEPVELVLLTGGNVLGPVEAAVRAAATRPVRVLAPEQAAVGAWRIATGAATALDGYPHELGIGVRQVVSGLLESVTMPVDGRVPITVEVETDHFGHLPVRVRIDGQGPWREAGQADPVRVPRGTYRVTALGRRGGLGAVLLRPAGPGADIVVPLGAEAGPAFDGTS